jgi:hypothetical protein
LPLDNFATDGKWAVAECAESRANSTRRPHADATKEADDATEGAVLDAV